MQGQIEDENQNNRGQQLKQTLDSQSKLQHDGGSIEHSLCVSEPGSHHQMYTNREVNGQDFEGGDEDDAMPNLRN